MQRLIGIQKREIHLFYLEYENKPYTLSKMPFNEQIGDLVFETIGMRIFILKIVNQIFNINVIVFQNLLNITRWEN